IIAEYKYGKIDTVYIQSPKCIKVPGFKVSKGGDFAIYSAQSDVAHLENVAQCYEKYREPLTIACNLKKKTQKFNYDLSSLRRNLSLKAKKLKTKVFEMER
ncbi:MAG: hypothetical protein IKY15_00675, partial [Clostridia bacterium]|nr:hypothetical protein [Clostridia bacterium]